MHYDPKEILIRAKEEIEKAAKDDYEKFAHANIIQCLAACEFLQENNMVVNFGATRGAIVPRDEDFVIKFDLDFFENFCDTEFKNYQAAKEEELEEFFAEIKPLGEFRILDAHMKCFVQTKAEEIYENTAEAQFSPISPDDFEDEDEYYEALYDREESVCDMNGDCLPYGWADRVIDEYGYDEYERLVHFLNEHDINDVHAGNVGFIRERCIIFDYAGF